MQCKRVGKAQEGVQRHGKPGDDLGRLLSFDQARVIRKKIQPHKLMTGTKAGQAFHKDGRA